MGDFLTKQGLRWGGEAGETGAEAVITRNPCRDWVISETLPEFCLASTLNRSQVSSRLSTSCPLAPCSSCQAGDRDTHNQTDYRVQRRWFVEEKRLMSSHTGPSVLNSPTGFYTGGQHSCVNHTVRLDAQQTLSVLVSLVMWLWAIYVTSLSLNFFSCGMRTLIIYTLNMWCEILWGNKYQEPHDVPVTC